MMLEVTIVLPLRNSRSSTTNKEAHLCKDLVFDAMEGGFLCEAITQGYEQQAC